MYVFAALCDEAVHFHLHVLPDVLSAALSAAMLQFPVWL
jgi:hypothetical protein